MYACACLNLVLERSHYASQVLFVRNPIPRQWLVRLFCEIRLKMKRDEKNNQ